jgi:TRAP-type C4-dicarboxylate transport system permease small subunit
MNVCSLLSGKESSVVSPIIYVIFFLFCFVFPPLSFEMMYILLIATYAVLKAHEKYIYIYIYA